MARGALWLALLAGAESGHGQGVGDGVAVLPVDRVRQQAPLFFSVTADTTVTAQERRVDEEVRLKVRVLQGRAETITVGLSGEGEVTGVDGSELVSWAVRRESDGSRFLDLKPKLPQADPQPLVPRGQLVPWQSYFANPGIYRPAPVVEPRTDGPAELDFTVRIAHEFETGEVFGLTLPGPGKAVGFASTVRLNQAAGYKAKLLEISGLSRIEGEALRFEGSGIANLRVKVIPVGGEDPEIELIEPALVGTVHDDSVSFVLRARVRVNQVEAAVPLFDGAALRGTTSGENWHVRLARKGDAWVHELVGDREGESLLEIPFEVGIGRNGDWHRVGFRMPSGTIVPVRLEGLGEGVSFEAAEPVVPERSGGRWEGFLNAAGEARFAWKEGGDESDGALFFSSSEVSEVRVGAGLVRQASELRFRILQGKLEKIRLAIGGEGEVLSVAGQQVLGWNVREADGARFLDVDLSRPIEGSGQLVVQAQAALGTFPVKAVPMRWTPEGTLRHSGHLRIANEGAVRLEILDAEGMMQLSPEQFPGGAAPEGLRQVFVYRFPSAEHSYQVAADRVLPEVSVSEVTIYEMGETDRVVAAGLELDIREAPVREWTVGIPEGFAVAEVQGAAVADYSVASEAENGVRLLKVLFGGPVAGRQLLSLRLERNQAAEVGDWVLPALTHPDARAARGYIGVATAPGYRVVTGASGGLVETPVDYFPKKQRGLQQTFRIREEMWSVTMQVEALGQSVQADVFHLYSLKEGVAYGSVVVNYFVVGAPSNEWRLQVPEGIGNVAVTGQGVGRDWRQEGDTLIVPLVRPALGASTILVTFEQPMGARGGTIRPGEVRPLEVQSERGYVQVTSPLQMNSTVATEDGSLLKIDASELPTEYRLLSSAPTLEAWQYTAGDIDIAMDVELYDTGETIGEIVDFASLASHVSRDGQVATTARFFVRSKASSSLGVTLPGGARLWEAVVAGERVNAREDDDRGVTLVPLPLQVDPNEPIEVVLRYGQALGAGTLELEAPRIGAATAVASWEVTGDEGRRLLPKGGTAELVRPVRTESGFEWLANQGRQVAPVVLVLAALGLVLHRIRPVAVLGWVSLAGAIVWSFALAREAWLSRRPNLGTLEYTSPAVLSEHPLMVKLANVEPWQAHLSSSGLLLALAGVACLVWALLRAVGGDSHVRLLIGAGIALVGYGLLAQRGGAVLFFVVFGLALFAGMLVPWTVAFFKGLKRKPAAAAAAMIVLTGVVVGDRAEAADPAESMTQRWVLDEGRLHGELEVRVRADEAGERFHLLSAPASLVAFEGAGIRVSKEGGHYYVVAAAPGVFEGTAGFEMAVPSPQEGWTVPCGPAAVQVVRVEMTAPGWSFHAEGAARVSGLDGLGEDRSGAEIVMGPGGASPVRVRPKQRDASREETRFYSEVSDLYVPGPGVVNGLHRVSLRPAQGVVKELVLTIPEGFTVGEVGEGPVGRWRFNPESRQLKVAVEPAQESPFAFSVATQRATGPLPVDLDLAPLRVAQSAGAVGMLGLAFGGEAQPEQLEPEGMSGVNPDDFDGALLPKDREGRPLAVLQKVYRYGAEAANLGLRVAPVAPEIRAELVQTLVLSDDRMVLAADLTAAITRAGVFKLTVELPEGLEVEAATGPALGHWTESRDGETRLLTLHLKGQTLGEQKFSISLAGPSPGSQDSWSVPRLALRDAARQRGTLTVAPERGLQVRAVSRTNVSQLDPSEAGVPRPGALAFKLLQADWELALAVQQLDPWVTAQVLQQVTLREGQSLTRARVVYRIENAARKALRVRVPGLDERARATVRATGPAVGDFVPVPDEEGLWEIRFQRGVAGETPVDIEFEQANGEDERAITTLELVDVRQSTYFVTVRTAGRLVATVSEVVRGWQKSEWNLVPPALREDRTGELPEFVYRVAEAEGPLGVRVAWHELAGSESLRVLEGRLATLVSLEGATITTVELKIDASEEATLALTLPDKATPFNLLVNGEGVPLVRDGETWRFYVRPSPLPDQPALVRFAYGLESARGALQAPSLSVPLENLVWDVYVPEGWALSGSRGDFELVDESDVEEVGLRQYLAAMARRRAEGKAMAVAELDQGYAWLRTGEQDKAGEVLGKAARNGFLDEASNEDARVQFRNLKMQQAVLGLNTRRQRMYLDNKFSGLDAQNQQLEQAAEDNPILQGRFNYDPQSFDRLMVGNSAEETSALKTIASCIVDQQIQVEGAREALDVELLGLGKRLRFTRSLQVEGDRPMALELDLRRERNRGWFYGGLVGALAAGVVVVGMRKGR